MIIIEGIANEFIQTTEDALKKTDRTDSTLES